MNKKPRPAAKTGRAVSAPVKNRQETGSRRRTVFKPGESGNPAGRPRGSLNKATAGAREAITRFVDGNAHRLQGWLDRIAERDPEKAFALVQSLIEYQIPKLARSDVTVTSKVRVLRFDQLDIEA